NSSELRQEMRLQFRVRHFMIRRSLLVIRRLIEIRIEKRNRTSLTKRFATRVTVGTATAIARRIGQCSKPAHVLTSAPDRTITGTLSPRSQNIAIALASSFRGLQLRQSPRARFQPVRQTRKLIL